MLPVYPLSFLVPRRKNLWVFGSLHGSVFSDNAKYFFLYCNRFKKDSAVQTAWISSNRKLLKLLKLNGLRAYHPFSFQGIGCTLRARVYFFTYRSSDINFATSGGAVKVNLWHGIPLKKIEHDRYDRRVTRAARLRHMLERVVWAIRNPEDTEKYHYVLTSSRFVVDRHASAFRLKPEQIITTGFPRTDILFSHENGANMMGEEEQAIKKKFESAKQNGYRILVYLPTFRDWNNSRRRALPIDWKGMDEMLTKTRAKLYCKLHAEDKSHAPDVTACENIEFISPDVDLYPFFVDTDALITDYSSVFFDYLFFDKPIVFYPFDLEDYQRHSRSFYDNYESVTPGPKASSPQDFTNLVGQLLSDYERERGNFQGRRRQIRELFYDHVDSQASERLFEEVFNRVLGSTQR